MSYYSADMIVCTQILFCLISEDIGVLVRDLSSMVRGITYFAFTPATFKQSINTIP